MDKAAALLQPFPMVLPMDNHGLPGPVRLDKGICKTALGLGIPFEFKCG